MNQNPGANTQAATWAMLNAMRQPQMAQPRLQTTGADVADGVNNFVQMFTGLQQQKQAQQQQQAMMGFFQQQQQDALAAAQAQQAERQQYLQIIAEEYGRGAGALSGVGEKVAPQLLADMQDAQKAARNQALLDQYTPQAGLNDQQILALRAQGSGFDAIPGITLPLTQANLYGDAAEKSAKTNYIGAQTGAIPQEIAIGQQEANTNQYKAQMDAQIAVQDALLRADEAGMNKQDREMLQRFKVGLMNGSITSEQAASLIPVLMPDLLGNVGKGKAFKNTGELGKDLGRPAAQQQQEANEAAQRVQGQKTQQALDAAFKQVAKQTEMDQVGALINRGLSGTKETPEQRQQRLMQTPSIEDAGWLTKLGQIVGPGQYRR